MLFNNEFFVVSLFQLPKGGVELEVDVEGPCDSVDGKYRGYLSFRYSKCLNTYFGNSDWMLVLLVAALLMTIKIAISTNKYIRLR